MAWLAIAVAVTLVSACGSRLSTAEIRAQGVVESSLSDTGGNTDLEAVSGEDTTPGADPDDPEATDGPGGGKSKTPVGQQIAPKSDGGSKEPIIIGYIGWLSGTGGETMSPTRDVWVAWSKAVNARGGINGHPVKLLVGDMGGNEERGISVARDFVENKGAIVLTLGGVPGAGIPNYAKSKGIPVLGSVPTTGQWHNNPMMFPPWGSTEANSWGAARMIKRSGKTKVAQVYCIESPDCADGAARMQRWAKVEGIEIVSSQRYSVVGANYTAECLNMKGSGAQVVYPTGDTGSMVRMAKACAQQGFKPIWVSPTMADNVASVPMFEGAIAITPAFPWFMRSGSPAIEEYTATIGKYASARLSNGSLFMAEAWVSVKLLEKAAANVGDKPTSQDILNGLWAMKGETLGGLTSGPLAITFTKDQPTPEKFCVFDTKLVGGKWQAPSGLTPVCR
jgi:branched-chain amino acid transport system substrate-binding protein